jgi:endonuclease/exonuclease/phosphatase (EEP) superfamily protein YafD
MPAKNKGVGRQFVLRVLAVANALGLVAVGLAAAAPYAAPSPWWPLGLVSLVMPWWALIPVVGGALWWGRSWAWVVVNGLALAMLVPQLGGAIQFNTVGPKAEGEITVLTLNCKALDYSEANIEKLEALIEQEKADLVLLQEFWTGNQRGERSVIARLKREGGYSQARMIILVPGNFGMSVLARLPVVNPRRITTKREGYTNGVMAVDVTVGGRVVRVYNAHLQSYNLRPSERAVLDSLQEGAVNEGQVRGTLGRLRRAWRKQVAQVNAVQRDRSTWQGPTLICGDLNNPPYGWVVHTLKGTGQDSYRERGSGLGHTFGERLAQFRIDYVLASREWQVLEHRVVATPASDHAAVVVRLRLGEAVSE